MSDSTKTGLAVLTILVTCIVLLALAIVTRETKYLLAESAVLHFALVFAILSTFERNRRDG